jgi:acyl carrier protein
LPALEFITSIGDAHRNEAGTSWTFPAQRLASVTYDPDEKAPIANEAPATVDPETFAPRPESTFGFADRSERQQRIAEDLCDIDRLAKAIEEYRLGKQPADVAADVTSGSALETALANMWKKVLGKPRIGLNDNFFDAGGNSLRAVQVIAMIKKELKQTLSIVTLFECPTIRLLGARLDAAASNPRGASDAGAAETRGQQRRRNAGRRRTALNEVVRR